jgi:hypothetical protein
MRAVSISCEVPSKDFDIISAIKKASTDFCKTEEGKAVYDEFVEGLSECIADDDAVIILESGNEKLRYVVGSAVVITNTDYEYMEISTLAAEMAAKLLNNSQWKTKISY